MSLCRNVGIGFVIVIITMLTLNIDIVHEEYSKDSETVELFRKRREVGYKPRSVFGICGGTHYGRQGWLASPNFPGSSYPSLSSCNWTITVYPRMVIRFDFVYMDMEDAPLQKKGSCRADYLMIREGPKEGDPLVGGQRYCGYDTPFNSVYSKSNVAYVYFASDIDIEGQGFAVRWLAVDPPKAKFDCDFESVMGLCIGWKQDETDDFDWSTHNGETQSGKTAATGPLTDHTKRDEFGVYLFTEASGIKQGEKARLVSPTVRVRNRAGQCFRFWYHMRGETMGTLNVYKREIFSETNSTDSLIFTESGDRGSPWRRADMNITASDNRLRFIFESIRGSSYKSDMAIDDIQLLRNPCPAPRPKPTTTTPPVTTRRVWRPRRTRPGRRRVPRVTTRAPRTRRTTTRRSRPATTPFVTTTEADCFYRCRDVGNCISADYFCDEVPDCLHQEDEADCSGSTIASATASQTKSWSTWSSWSTCTVTCGGGRTERERTCSAESLFSCEGSSSEGMECNTHICLSWNEWGGWGACTFTCGGGLKTRARTCNGGPSGQPGCFGPLIQLDYCNRYDCPKWGDWSEWSQCQATCGNGTISRSRVCQAGQDGQTGCSGNSTEYSSCTNPTMPSCGEWTDWSEFSECTRTCGVGRRSRIRQCMKDGSLTDGCPGFRQYDENCNTFACPEWTPWSKFGECSVTCGAGNRSRTRKCLQQGVEALACPGDSSFSESCSFEPCIEWADWTSWSTCTASCNGGFHGRRRFCMMGDSRTRGCLGRSIESGKCNEQACPRWREWGNWQSCSRSCGGGIRERRRSCDGGAPGTGDCLGTDIEQEPCSEQPCEIPAKWRDWGNWQSCSRTCGGGVRERRRSCEGGAPNTGECMGSDKEEENCNQQQCQPPSTAAITTTQSTRPPQRARRWGEWSDFSECSKTCDQGTMIRTRTCIGGRPGQLGCRNGARQTRKCNNGQCTTTTESTTTTIATTTQRPRGWDLWSDWMPCSVSCGDGTTTRSRQCVGGRPGQRGCRGKRQEKKKCGSPCPVATAASAFAAECMERDGRRARISGRRCPSECSADRDCDEDEKCVCDGFCGKTCQDPSKSCLDLQTNPAGTIVTCSNKNSVGSVCAFSCEDGYELQGNSNVFCQGNSKWTNQKKLPRCEKSEESSSETTPACTFAKRAHDACCGKKSYNSRSAKCCNGKVSPGGPAATECCGTRPYDPKKRGCCKTKLFRLPNQKCQNGKVRKNE